MRQTVLKYGILSGLIAAAFMAATLPFIDNLGHGAVGALVGYTGMVLAFLLVFFGVRSYREQNGGTISFGKAFGVGLLIMLITCVFYVATWEIIYFRFMPHFMDNYGNAALAHMRAAGASAEAIQKKTAELAAFKKMYNNPLYNAFMTLMEPLPVGLVMTLLSAAILRKKSPAAQAAAA